MSKTRGNPFCNDVCPECEDSAIIYNEDTIEALCVCELGLIVIKSVINTGPDWRVFT